MEDVYLIDRHKIMFHPERLSEWLKVRHSWEKAKKIYPIYIEISLSGLCNHRCKFCALDYLGYKGGFANFANLKKAIKDMAEGGVKSIQFGGEGEPLLYPKAKEIIQYAKSLGIDVSLATNGAFLTEKFLKDALPFLSWIKVSIDAGKATTHLKIHRPKIQDFNTILQNLKKAVEIKNKKKYQCALGGQMLLLPDNYREAIILAKKLKKIGFDYLTIKPYSQHKKSINREYENISYEKYFYLKSRLKKLSSSKFRVIFREKTMKKLRAKPPYKICRAVPFFWVYFMTNGDVYSCSSYLGDKKFKLGNYNEKPFKKIWEGDKRKKHWQFIQTEFDIKQCRENCRMDEINRYLERLKNPPPHVNFI